MNLTLYCNSYNGLLPLYQQYNQKTLMCGSSLLSNDILNACLERGDVLDNTKKNISSLNNYLGDLTGLYWIWKNSDDEFVGTNQYRRFYNEQQLNYFFPLNVNTLFVSNFINLECDVWQHFIKYHGNIGLKILYESINLKKIKIKKEHTDLLYKTNLISPCNMFFGHKKIFDLVCEKLFEIVFELYEGTKYALGHIQDNIHIGRDPNDKRLIAFLSERVLNILYFNSSYYFGDIKIQPISYGTIN